ncbi:DNA-binding response regulator [Pedobacter yulinensis]|uniref:DNA-binding response regulator n=1 Tax=Pedobacter yulinensis TaxID=2126353 RepID=A0A2T3HNY1_9SPHI|nr:LytTR family DNA-binding domain-containing protein [Pedobacter yulinensis]PST84154.1 DNA-binding response regulator [Pedobacter yulinensis]
MKVLIIEDEIQTAWDLKQILLGLHPGMEVLAVVDSVEAGKDWFFKHQPPDLIFSDIQLGDGLSFEIFQELNISIPVIFCTAYDDYLLQAFKTNGIDYILKPLKEAEVAASLKKHRNLQHALVQTAGTSLRELSSKFLQQPYKRTFLVSYREKLFPVDTDSIYLFKLAGGLTELCTAEGKKYNVSCTLDHLESVLDPDKFYRANRQVILSRSGIAEIEHYFERKLLVFVKAVKEPIVVSKAKSSQFLNWLEAGPANRA